MITALRRGLVPAAVSCTATQTVQAPVKAAAPQDVDHRPTPVQHLGRLNFGPGGLPDLIERILHDVLAQHDPRVPQQRTSGPV